MRRGEIERVDKWYMTMLDTGSTVIHYGGDIQTPVEGLVRPETLCGVRLLHHPTLRPPDDATVTCVKCRSVGHRAGIVVP